MSSDEETGDYLLLGKRYSLFQYESIGRYLSVPGKRNELTGQKPKRVNFISIQSGHSVACTGYKQPMIRTGYEQVMGQRTTDMFCLSAKQDGEVISKSEKGIIVLHKDGTKKGIEIGRRFGSAGGVTYPHDIATTLNVGDKFKNGDILAYNTGFFEIDHYNKKNVIWKSNLLAKTVLWESNQTIEDASSISMRLAEKLSMKTTKVKKIVVEFDKEVRNLVKAGQKLEPTTILCTIEDSITSASKLFDEESLNTLKMLSNQTPTSKVFGTVDKVEVFYHGDKEDMSQSLLEISNLSDREMSRTFRSRGEPGFNGSVTDDFRIDGNPLLMDTMVINIYITSDVGTAVGDKGVFANQMKTVFSEVMTKDMMTESGEIIDAVFGQKSIEARVVCSPAIIGTTNTLLKVIASKAVKMFKES